MPCPTSDRSAPGSALAVLMSPCRTRAAAQRPQSDVSLVHCLSALFTAYQMHFHCL